VISLRRSLMRVAMGYVACHVCIWWYGDVAHMLFDFMGDNGAVIEMVFLMH
jgi:hypothetical protein